MHRIERILERKKTHTTSAMQKSFNFRWTLLLNLFGTKQQLLHKTHTHIFHSHTAFQHFNRIHNSLHSFSPHRQKQIPKLSDIRTDNSIQSVGLYLFLSLSPSEKNKIVCKFKAKLLQSKQMRISKIKKKEIL